MLTPRQRRWLLASGVLAVTLIAVVLGGQWYASGQIRDKIESKCGTLGLRCELGRIGVSALGSVTLEDLKVTAGSERPLVVARRVGAKISVVSVLAGSRRPEAVTVEGATVDLTVDTNTPKHVQRLLSQLRGAPSQAPKSAGAKRALPAIHVRDASMKVAASGGLKRWLPEPVQVTSLELHFDPSAGQGQVTGQISGLGSSSLSATMTPKSDTQPAHLSARFTPPLKHKLPKVSGMPDAALQLGGLGFDADRGVSLEGVAVAIGGQPAVTIGSTSVERREEGWGLLLAKISVQVSSATVAQAMGAPKKAPPPGAAVWRMAVGALDVTAGQQLTARVNDISGTSPDGALQVALASGTASWPKPSLRWPNSVKLDSPVVSLPLKEEPLKSWHPSGVGLFMAAQRLLGRAKEAKPAPAAEEPKKRKRRKKRRAGRKPYTTKAIGPLRALTAAINRSDERLSAGLKWLNKIPCEVSVSGGSLGLRDTAAREATVGVKLNDLTLGRRTSDGSRSMALSLSPFDDGGSWGVVTSKLKLNPGAKFGAASVELKGEGGFARGLSRWFGWLNAQSDAKVSATLRFDDESGWSGHLRSHHLGPSWWRLAPSPVDDFTLDTDFTLSATRKPAGLRLKFAPLRLNDAQLNVALTLEKLDTKPTVVVDVQAPKQDCGKLLGGIPTTLIPTIGVIEAKGPMQLSVKLQVPLKNPYKGKLESTFDDELCEVTKLGKIDVGALAGEFKRPVNESGTLLEDQLIGPSSDSWVPLKELPAWVPYTIMVTEDAAFFKHRGMRQRLTERAIKMCLDYGRFVYGGSTLTQQLVKNLYLTRDKYLGRKLEEILIVWRLERDLYADLNGEEQQVATKDRIIELYVNSIEFGPHTYGIERGSQLYFGKSAVDLTPLEVAFLAANKPCPKCGHRVFTRKKWTPWWQTRMEGIVKKMRRDKIITDEQFMAEAPYVPKFLGWPQSEADDKPGGGVGGEEE